MRNISLHFVLATFAIACSDSFDKDDQNGIDGDQGNVNPSTASQQTDKDGDGFTMEEGDCNDNNVDYNLADEDGDGYSTCDGDCDDNDASKNPRDIDGDGYSTCDDDCDDQNENIYPNNPIDEAYDDIDSDCAGDSDFDQDQDGHDAFEHGGDDCDDEDGDLWDECPRFKIEIVDEQCIDCPGPNAMDITPEGDVYVVYQDNGSLYSNSRDLAGKWSGFEYVPTDTGTPAPDLGLDGIVDNDGKFLISYASEYSGGLGLLFQYYAAGWSAELEVDGPTTQANMNVGSDVVMAIDSNNMPTFLYHNADSRMPIIYDMSSGVTSTLTQLTGVGPIAVDQPLLLPNVFTDYYSGVHNSIAIDENNNSHMAFFNSMVSVESQYSMVPDLEGIWGAVAGAASGTANGVCLGEPIASNGIYNSLDFHPSGELCIAFQDEASGDLKYGCKINSSCMGWNFETIDTVGAYAQLVHDSEGNPHIAYQDELNRNLKIASHTSTGWIIEVIDDEGAVGQHINLAIDSKDKLHVTYADETHQQIKYASGY